MPVAIQFLNWLPVLLMTAAFLLGVWARRQGNSPSWQATEIGIYMVIMFFVTPLCIITFRGVVQGAWFGPGDTFAWILSIPVVVMTLLGAWVGECYRTFLDKTK